MHWCIVCIDSWMSTFSSCMATQNPGNLAIEAAPMEQVLPRQFVGTQRWFWCYQKRFYLRQCRRNDRWLSNGSYNLLRRWAPESDHIYQPLGVKPQEWNWCIWKGSIQKDLANFMDIFYNVIWFMDFSSWNILWSQFPRQYLHHFGVATISLPRPTSSPWRWPCKFRVGKAVVVHLSNLSDLSLNF